MKIMNELNQRFAEGKAEGRAEASEEIRLLGERLVADGRTSQAFEVLTDPERLARELERYGICAGPADVAIPQRFRRPAARGLVSILHAVLCRRCAVHTQPTHPAFLIRPHGIQMT